MRGGQNPCGINTKSPHGAWGGETPRGNAIKVPPEGWRAPLLLSAGVIPRLTPIDNASVGRSSAL